jgi:5,10-methylene-tetrahydrofolate dehydrogenase/methenyl tetrahydrofolate cyclohydrolase
MSNIIDGKYIYEQIVSSLKRELVALRGLRYTKALQRLQSNQYFEYAVPGLAVIQIGDKMESSVYIKKKCEACADVGFYSEVHKLEPDVTDDSVIALIDKLNANTRVNGILVQLPLPKHLNESKILNHIACDKDIDGFHAQNIGELAMTNREPAFVPCTPLGCLKILKHENIKLTGSHVVVIGKSNIVGLPMSLLLLKEGATVTVCHIDTKDLQSHTKRADIIVSACGQPEMIKKDWVKEGVVVIDVGTNFIPDSTKKSGKKLVGDVDFNEVKEVAHKISPVPGGVGPMTVAMLLSNTLKAFKMQNGLN